MARIDTVLAKHAALAETVYADRTAGDYTFIGLLADFLSEALPALQADNEEGTAAEAPIATAK